jgi:hypothetical protein
MLNLLLQVAGFIEKLGPMEHEERLSLLKASFGIPSEPACGHDFDYLPECTRDRRHVGDRVWHPYYHMSTLLESKFMSTSQSHTHEDIIQCVTLSIIDFLVMHCHYERGRGEDGKRRRRLTLAPRPWATARHGETAEKVSSALFAGSSGSDNVWGLADCERTAEGMPCSSVGSTSELRSEFKRVANGSRFWALDGEVSTDEEVDMGVKLASGLECSPALSGKSCSDREPPVAAALLCTARAARSICARPER